MSWFHLLGRTEKLYFYFVQLAEPLNSNSRINEIMIRRKVGQSSYINPTQVTP